MRLRRAARTGAVERIDDASAADDRVLEHLVELGSDPTQPRAVRHFLYLPERQAAETVAEQLHGDGWQTSIGESEEGWLVVAGRVRELTAEVVRETRSLLEALASAHGGVYDGWEATAS
jgi:regulator of RNase E activity RraB